MHTHGVGLSHVEELTFLDFSSSGSGHMCGHRILIDLTTEALLLFAFWTKQKK